MTIPLLLNSILAGVTNTQYNHCPNCGTKFIRISANNNYIRIYCTKCFWEIFAMVINKNETI